MSRWILAYNGYDPAAEGLREALCTLGNGYFATRGAAPESSADDVHYPGTYIAGCYGRLTAEIGGRRFDNADLVNMPNRLPLTFRAADGEWFDPDRALQEDRLLSCRQELDLRRGVLTRLVRSRDRAGRTFRVASAAWCPWTIRTWPRWRPRSSPTTGPVRSRSGRRWTDGSSTRVWSGTGTRREYI
ncbi:hypothetical protein LUX39_50595 [Actinomadura madurae]|nr:hypothetical protein [Actinomadura madurae]MCP9955461.1 hypothetical protein [Actinomadura madurae]MCP9972198.1 hypothetical protein [Actinomadura madurae]MCP9984700.1 hypothetical protein [Actinomadura madurae]MCQ0003750.1 hypothetical protein [Actinomadura madurae]MCQ0020892.1 hypothetical protein [Actinomadura madurae]